MKNNNMKKSKSFKETTQSANIFMVVIMIVCVTLFNTINAYSVDKYSETTNSLRTLSMFYDHVESMRSEVKEYLYTKNEGAKIAYLQYYHEANQAVQEMQGAVLESDRWRFKMLEDMLNSYQKTCDELMNCFVYEKASCQPLYNTFLKRSELFQKTSSEYYKLITKSVSKQVKRITYFKNVTIIASIALLILALLWLNYYARHLRNAISNPIGLLLKNIQKVKQGKYDLSQISNAGREMEDLCEALNDMALAVENNIETTKEKAKLEKQLLEEKNENLKKDELLAQSELKMLQNQINPHFLFNTLNMIHRLSLQEGAKEAADLLVKTCQLLRYGLDKQSKLSDIKSEVEMLKNYIEIQKKRLGNRVSFTVSFSDEKSVSNVAIPGMILQPLVENAIKHGLKDCMEGGLVEISIFADASNVYLCVSDNGVGMDSNELDELIINDYHKEGNHLGLYNVIKRLQMYYQNSVAVSINSDLDCGFEILIKIVC
ncbi:MAG: sensor histidine kinase [Erysipelotrichia bacterium]|nr:sensor histidine kinase [Erysipelotrichia bacterium]NCC54031.1 sensor histidine kinase [Erysipelotrichia bacterium]